MPGDTSDAVRISDLVRTADGGDGPAADALFTALYAELHSIAERQLRQNAGDITLGTTTLLHEAYLNITRREHLSFASQGHFLAYAARAMRGLTIDYARRHRAKKRGGEFHITASGADRAGAEPLEPAEPLERLGSALDQLGAADPALAQLVDLHFFCGFTFVEVAGLRGVSERTVQRDWRRARLLLHRVLQDA